MIKAALILAAILLLAFSAGLTEVRPQQSIFDQRTIASLALNVGRPRAVAGAAALVSAARGAATYDTEDVLAPALLVYLAFVLIVGGIAVGIVRHIYRRRL